MAKQDDIFWVLKDSGVPARYFAGQLAPLTPSPEQAHSFFVEDEARTMALSLGLRAMACRVISFGESRSQTFR